MKIANFAEKMNNPPFLMQCLESQYPMTSQRKHFIVYIYIIPLL